MNAKDTSKLLQSTGTHEEYIQLQIENLNEIKNNRPLRRSDEQSGLANEAALFTRDRLVVDDTRFTGAHRTVHRFFMCPTSNINLTTLIRVPNQLNSYYTLPCQETLVIFFLYFFSINILQHSMH